MEKLLDSKKVRLLLGGISDSTLTRWSSDESDFPKPLQQKRRAKRLWSESSLLRWIESKQSTHTPLPATESAAQRQKRHKAACKTLKTFGIKFTEPTPLEKNDD